LFDWLQPKPPRNVIEEIEAPRLSHFLYFEARVQAETAAQALRGAGYETQIVAPAGEAQWLVLASEEPLDDEDDLKTRHEFFRRLAEALEGKYDGWETGPIVPD
jgi:hypothetical protein